MSVEESKPVVVAPEATDAAAPIEPLPVVAVDSTETPAAAPVTAASAEAPVEPAAEPAADAAPAAETVEENKEEQKVAEPIYAGTLSYAAHHSGLEGIKSLIMGPKKRYFWFGEEAPVTIESLKNFLRGEKPKHAHPVAAWSNKTGRGLLYFSKTVEDKAHPLSALLLAHVTDITESHAPNEFSFKLDGTKHVFSAKSADERAGWVAALKKVHEEAKAAEADITGSAEYKESLTALNKPVVAGLAAAGASGAAAKKAAETGSEPQTETASEPAEAAEATKPVEEPKKRTPKSRSVSRSKRTSIFGSIMGKKEEVEEKLEAKKEEKKAEKEKKAEEEVTKEEPAAVDTPVTTTTDAAVVASEPKPEEATTTAATDATVVEPKTEEAESSKPALGKVGKRGSIFGKFFDKVSSPSHEKKESEVVPAVAAADEPKDAEVTPVTAPVVVEPVVEEPAKTEPVAIPAVEKKEEKSASNTPKESFFGKFAQKLRSPSSETPPALPKDEKTDEVAPATETPVIPVTDATAPAPTVDAETAPAETTVPSVEEPKANDTEKPIEKKEEPEKRRSSFFGGGFGSNRKDKPTSGDESESSSKKLSGLFRNPSKLIKGQKEGKKSAAPAKVEEETKVSDEAPKLDAPEQSEPLSEETKVEDKPTQIGDVVPEAVQIGQPPAATPAVSATA